MQCTRCFHIPLLPDFMLECLFFPFLPVANALLPPADDPISKRCSWSIYEVCKTNLKNTVVDVVDANYVMQFSGKSFFSLQSLVMTMDRVSIDCRGAASLGAFGFTNET